MTKVVTAEYDATQNPLRLVGVRDHDGPGGIIQSRINDLWIAARVSFSTACHC